MQNRIGHVKGIGKCGTLICQPEQILIRDNNQRIHIGLQGLNTFICLFHSALAFKIKRFGDNANGQNTALSGGFCNDRCGPCAGAATHACGDENHIGIRQLCHDIIKAFFCCLASHFRFGTCTKTAC